MVAEFCVCETNEMPAAVFPIRWFGKSLDSLEAVQKIGVNYPQPPTEEIDVKTLKNSPFACSKSMLMINFT